MNSSAFHINYFVLCLSKPRIMPCLISHPGISQYLYRASSIIFMPLFKPNPRIYTHIQSQYLYTQIQSQHLSANPDLDYRYKDNVTSARTYPFCINNIKVSSINSTNTTSSCRLPSSRLPPSTLNQAGSTWKSLSVEQSTGSTKLVRQAASSLPFQSCVCLPSRIHIHIYTP